MIIIVLLISIVALWIALFCVGFLLVGALRALGMLTWRLDQIEAIRPSRIGREGLSLGSKAPDFSLPCIESSERSLHDFAGRKLLLVFTQSGCGPCREIVPELNRIHDRGEHQVLVVNNGDLDTTRQWAVEAAARFPVLVQEKFSLSKTYEVFVTPFAFLVDEHGIIASKGIAGSRQYLNYVLTCAGYRDPHDLSEPESSGSQNNAFEVSHSSKETIHV